MSDKIKIARLLKERKEVLDKMNSRGSMGSRKNPTAKNYTPDLRRIGTELEKLGYKDW